MRNSTGWRVSGRTSEENPEAGGLRRRGMNLIMLGAFLLVAGGAAGAIGQSALPMEALTLIGVVLCLAGWRALVVARRRDQLPPPSIL